MSSLVSNIFGGGQSAPAPMPMPASPMNDSASKAAQEAAARDAQIARLTGGRQSTIVGGMQLATSDQYARGEKYAEQRKSVLG